MFEQINEGEFIQRFVILDRKENFSYKGRKALFDYFEQMEEDSGKKIEFDCIAICCEYTEYKDIQAFWKEREGYERLFKDYDGKYKDLDAIRDETEVIEIDKESFIIKRF